MNDATWAELSPLFDLRDELVKSVRRLVQTDAEDVAQEALLKIARSYERGKIDLSAALDPAKARNVTWQLALNFMRDNRTKEVPVSPDDMTGMIDSPRALTAERGLFVSDFNEALEALPEAQSQAFILTELRGLTNREAGEMLGVEHTTIMRRAEQARSTLAKELS